jgi:hypothetical protein
MQKSIFYLEAVESTKSDRYLPGEEDSMTNQLHVGGPFGFKRLFTDRIQVSAMDMV